MHRRRLLLTTSALAASLLPPGIAPSAADPPALGNVLSEARALPQLHALLIAQGGRLVLAERLRGPALDRPVNVKSVAKSVIAALVGADGLGKPVVRALNTVNVARGFEAGLAIVLLAIMLDRLCRRPGTGGEG